jgi:hypothetical protein
MSHVPSAHISLIGLLCRLVSVVDTDKIALAQA